MAKQKGIIKLKGAIGDISFYRTKDGYMAREKGSLDAHRIATDPKFQRTRENGAEFGRAGRAGKILRRAFRELILQARDGRMVGRLTSEMVKVIQADKVSKRGLRNVLDGELEMLKGFNFSIEAELDTVTSMPYECSIDRVTGLFTTSIPMFDPEESILQPPGTTHYRFVMGAASIDFEGKIAEVKRINTDYLELSALQTDPITLEITLAPNSTHPQFLALGIIFYQEMNGSYYPLKDSSHNALALTAINSV